MEYPGPPFAFADQFEAKPEVKGKDRFDFNYIHSYAASCATCSAMPRKF